MSEEKRALIEAVKRMQIVLEAAKTLKKSTEKKKKGGAKEDEE